jgi:integrase
MAKGIEIRWSAGRWVFRARLEIGARVMTGPWHERQELAVEDRRQLILNRERLPDRVLTFGDALARVVADARERGLPEATVRKHYVCHTDYLSRVWRVDLRMVEIDAAQVRMFVRQAVEEWGRSPNTLRQKDLPILEQCYRAAGLKSPVAAVRAEMRSLLKPRPPRMKFFEPAQVVELIDRMRNAELWHPKPCEGCEKLDEAAAAGCQVCGGWGTVDDHDRPPRSLPAREADADLVEFLASTGVRSGELGRVRLEDVDLERGAVHVAVPKDKGNPRDLVVPPSLAPVVERLVRRAEGLAAEGANPGRLLVPSVESWLGNIGRRWQVRLRDRRLSGRALRHTFVTGLLVSGVNPNDARDLAGHKSLKTTDRYTHLVSGRRESAAKKWSEHLELLREQQRPPAPADDEDPEDGPSP